MISCWLLWLQWVLLHDEKPFEVCSRALNTSAGHISNVYVANFKSLITVIQSLNLCNLQNKAAHHVIHHKRF